MSNFDRNSSTSSRESSSSTGDTWFVAVSREAKESDSVLLWTLENLKNLGGTEICILHVHRPDKQIHTGLGWLPLGSANERQINSHRAMERERLSEKLDKYLQICRQRQVKARKVHVEMDSIEEGIIKLLKDNEVGKLVMGAASDKRYKRGMIAIKSEKAKYVNKHAPGYCQIWFVCSKLLIYTRKEPVQSGNSSPVPSEYNEGETSRSSSRSSSARSSFVGSWIGNEADIQLGKIPSVPRRNPSKEDGWNAVDTWIMKDKFENSENEKAKISKELQDVRDQKFALDSRIEKSDQKVEELERNLASTMQLVESYKKALDATKKERDNAIRQVEQVMKQLNEGASPAVSVMFCSEFPSLEIQNATNSFDPSMKVGEDAYGSIYKGFLRLTEVAVKIPHPDNPLILQEFQKEVEISCKLRHPNIVNLIGICTESHALIYEQCANGTLEDQLTNKDQGSHFQWQIRVKIATELCNVLAFIHSHKPKPVIHGDLRPENIHLDSNYTCKLNGFKISNAISSGEFSLENKGSFYRGDSEARSYPYIDPEFFAGGELTTRSDVYALGVILLRLLTGKQAVKLARRVQIGVESDKLSALLDTSAGWPLDQAKQLADLALWCCEKAHDLRPDLDEDLWKVLESLKGSCDCI